MSELEDLTPTPTQAQLDAIKRGEVGVTDVADTAVEDGKAGDQDEAQKAKASKDVAADAPTAYKTRQAKVD